jgi:hypothetical protein
MYINTNDRSTPTHNQISGLITQAHARQLNNQVSSFLASYSSYLDNGNVYYVLLLRNDGAPGKLLESTFICIKPQVHIMSEPAAIVIGAETFFCQRCCDTLFLAYWVVYHVEYNLDAS